MEGAREASPQQAAQKRRCARMYAVARLPRREFCTEVVFVGGLGRYRPRRLIGPEAGGGGGRRAQHCHSGRIFLLLVLGRSRGAKPPVLAMADQQTGTALTHVAPRNELGDRTATLRVGQRTTNITLRVRRPCVPATRRPGRERWGYSHGQQRLDQEGRWSPVLSLRTGCHQGFEFASRFCRRRRIPKAERP